MASMVIRNIPDDVMDRFKARAKAAGKSTEQLAREAIAEKGAVSREELFREADRIRAMSKPVNIATALRIMQEARDERDARPYLPDLDDDR
jgi:plasmid stability protein